MGVKQKESWWVRLKRAIRRLRVPPMAGDGGAHSDKGIVVSSPQPDSSSVVRDTVTIKPWIRQ